MKDFMIRVEEADGNVHIYTNATAVEIVDDKLTVEHSGDQSNTHLLDFADEITIKNNRQ